MGEIYTGNNISIDNTGNKKAKITKINGGYRQKTREGYNKLNLKDWFISEKSNITLVGDIQENSVQFKTNKTIASTGYYLRLRNTLPAGTYYFQRKFETIEEGLGGNNYGNAFIAKSDWSVEYCRLAPTDDKKSFTLDSETEVYLTLVLKGSADTGTDEREIKYYDLMLSNTDEEYEPYGVMPSPDYPSKVETVGSNVNELIYPFIDTTKTTNGITFTDNGDGTVTANGTATAKAYFNLSKTTLNPGKHILSIEPGDGGNSSPFKYFVKFGTINITKTHIFELTESFTPTESYLCINEGVTVNNLVFKIKIEPGEKATSWSPYGTGNIEININNKNFLKLKEVNKNERGLDISANENVLRINGISTSSGNTINLFEDKRLKKGTYTFSFISKNSPVMNSSQFILCEENGNRIVTLNAWGDTNFKIITLEKDTVISSNKSYFYYNNNMTFNNTQYELQIEPGSTATEIIMPESQSKIMPIQQEMLEGDYIEDVEHHEWGKKILTGGEEGWANSFGTNLFNIQNFLIDINQNEYEALCNYFTYNPTQSGIDDNTDNGDFAIQLKSTNVIGNIFFKDERFSTVADWKEWLAQQYAAGTPVIVYYKLATPIDLGLTPEQSNVAYQLENIELFDGMNYITATSSIDPELEVTVENPVEDYKIQISSDGYLIIPELSIKYLIDLNESNIPIMPEATESSVRAAGRDGDIVLNTTYEPITFDIVCYTEDNLTYSEKINAEKNMNRFLNSIKNKTIEIAFEKNNSFYKVKYSGALVTTNFPKHLKFAIPLKSSDSYGKDLIQKSIVGNDTGESNTIEEVGAVFVIKGPALNPIISLNDYSMEYTTSILEGARVEIDSNKSTITNINNDGVKTNVMKYYNHQFPKIQNGTNTLKILSGIDNDKNVIVMWNDLKL